MARKREASSFSVEVEPRRLGNFGSVSMSDSLVTRDAADALEQYRERCEEIANQIRRHVDNVGSVAVRAHTDAVCEFCGSAWTEDGDDFNGGCCESEAHRTAGAVQ